MSDLAQDLAAACDATVINVRGNAHVDCVYIGRGAWQGQAGVWGNPFRVSATATREDVIAHYRRWLWDRVKADPTLVEQLAALHGKRLGCWCAPAPCHGDVLVAAARWAHGQPGRFWCPDCGQSGTHAQSCSCFPGEPVVHGNRTPPPTQ